MIIHITDNIIYLAIISLLRSFPANFVEGVDHFPGVRNLLLGRPNCLRQN